ncbi:MAG: hypothetical protein KJ995_04650 [Candidatus Omnitrophica bacterium]|nr:hypothetical protein [Candidatus Omnitrophota bacterium]MBU1784560.1 hypothetical protein [Candidatus Omnitrophota bacterium]MBU1851675.1 hypothetical protein [Candidatus Omnitrophota bacterium]
MKIICFVIIMSLALAGIGNSSAFALTNEQLLEKMNELENQLAAVRSELTELREERTRVVAVKPGKTVDEKIPVPKFTALPEIELYGFIKTDFSYDTSRTNNPDAPGYVMSEDGVGDDNQFAATAQNSRFGINMTGPEIWNGQVKGKVEIDFLDATSDNSFRPRIRHLYLDVVFPGWSLLFGQTWDVVGPLGPATLNTNGWLWRAGNIGFRRTQARLTNILDLSCGDCITTRISANRNIGAGNDTLNTGEDSGWPLMEARVSYATRRLFDRKTEIGIGGLYGEEEFDRTPAASDDHWSAKQWGFVADAVIPVYDSITLKGEGFYGRDLNAFLAGIGLGANTTKETGILAYGGWGQVSYKMNDYIVLNSGYGIDNADKDDINSGQRTRNQIVFANVIYSPIEHLKFGIEYSHWYTEYLNANNGENNRIQSAVIWDF